jgi:hypothetical protein
MNSTRIVGLLVLALGVTLAASASADLCKSPKVKVVNDRSDTIKVTKIEYLDGCDDKWRTEDVPATEVLAGKSKTFTDSLEHVGNCKIKKFKLYRAIRKDSGSAYGSYAWGSELVPDEGSNQVCNTGVTFTVHAHE